MTARFRLAAAVTATTVALTACSAPFSHSHVRPSPFTTHAPARVHVSTGAPSEDTNVAPLTVAAEHLHNESSWNAPRYTVQWPDFADAAGLSSALEDTVTRWKKNFVDASHSDSDSGQDADLSVVWEPVVNAAPLRGIRLTNHTTEAEVVTTTETVYGTTDETWHSIDLVAPTRRAALIDAVRRAAQQDAHVSTGSDVDAAKVFEDVTFDRTGTMIIRIPAGAIGPASAGLLTAEVSNPETYLSAAGRHVRDVAMKDAGHTTAPGSASPITPAETHTDCAKAKCIALTFDDGPGVATESILDTLQRTHAKATFFMLGPAVQAAPDTVRRMANLGMALGDHSWTHPQFPNLSNDQVTSEITRQADAVEKVTGQRPVAVRPPFGAFTSTTPHAGFPFVLWNVDTEDWKNRNADATTKRALDGAQRGAIVLMHDIRPSTAKALPGIIASLQHDGYTLVTIGDLIPTMKTDGA